MPRITMTAAEIQTVLQEHQAWLNGAGGSRANLSRVSLSRANLSGANLSGANLSEANLSGASLSGANLSEANLSGASLSEANLSGASLSGASLSGANLSEAYLSRANLSEANLSEANLSGANLSGADLSRAYLSPHMVCPEAGAFTAFKKLRGGVVATLLIPKDAGRTSSLVGRKCRASRAVVVKLENRNGIEIDCAYSIHHHDFPYVVGEEVAPDGYNSDIRIECAPGIHFFVTRKEAEQYG